MTTCPTRIAAGWYKTETQLTLSLIRGDGFERETVWSRIVPPRCRFRVRPVDGLGRDVWHQVEALTGQARYQRIEK